MQKIRLTKISGDKLIPVLSSKKGIMKVGYLEGYPNREVYSSKPTVGILFGIYNDDGSSFRTSPVKEILSGNTFRTENSTYKWERII